MVESVGVPQAFWWQVCSVRFRCGQSGFDQRMVVSQSFVGREPFLSAFGECDGVD